MSIQSDQPSQIASGATGMSAGPQQVVQISDTGFRWVIGLLLLMNIIIALCMLGLGFAISESNRAVDKAETAANESAQQKQAVIRLQASLVARGIALPTADPFINGEFPTLRRSAAQ